VTPASICWLISKYHSESCLLSNLVSTGVIYGIYGKKASTECY
jgi:hypothetical protein